MLATWTTPQTRGKVFGFHRSMDHAGAVLGPALATLFLYFYPGSYRTLFGLTIIPGLIADRVDLPGSGTGDGPAAPRPCPRGPEAARCRKRPRIKAARRCRASSSRSSSCLTLFTLGNSTDAFLLLKLTDVAGSAKFIPLMWAALHVVKASVSIVGGSWSDRIGRRAVIALGWLVYAAVYVGFALSNTLTAAARVVPRVRVLFRLRRRRWRRRWSPTWRLPCARLCLRRLQRRARYRRAARQRASSACCGTRSARRSRSALAPHCRSSRRRCCSASCGADTIQGSHAADSRHQRRRLPFAGDCGAGRGTRARSATSRSWRPPKKRARSATR